jgi:uncharacterized UBP type Zn finger protein
MRVESARFEEAGCEHSDAVRAVEPNAEGCEGCMAEGRDDWVSLRVCLTCGHVGCCDSSPGKHATAHWEETGHPVIHAKAGEWAWCYEDEVRI